MMFLDLHHGNGDYASQGIHKGLCPEGAFKCAHEEREHPGPPYQLASSRVSQCFKRRRQRGRKAIHVFPWSG